MGCTSGLWIVKIVGAGAKNRTMSTVRSTAMSFAGKKHLGIFVATALATLLLTAVCSIRPRYDPVSGHARLTPGEEHYRAGDIYIVQAMPSTPGERTYPTAVIYGSGTRLPVDAPQVYYCSAPDRAGRIPFRGVPAFSSNDFPLVVFAESDNFKAARRATDGSVIQAP